MKRNQLRVRTRFEPETRFEVTPVPPAPFRAIQETELERLKNQLLYQRLGETAEPELNVPLRRAANEAAAVAWATRYPLLVFPTLFDEIAHVARVQAKRQEQILERSRELVFAA